MQRRVLEWTPVHTPYPYLEIADAMATTTVYTVNGMTCGHCVASVREEVAELAGVTDVEVDLATGRLTVTGDASAAQVAAAVDEAGYELVS